jgi:excisionase family DNA binding protein
MSVVTDLPRWLSPPQIAQVVGVTPEKIIAMIRSGELRAIDVATRGSRRPRFRVTPEDLDAWARGREAVPTPSPPAPRRGRRSGVKEC